MCAWKKKSPLKLKANPYPLRKPSIAEQPQPPLATVPAHVNTVPIEDIGQCKFWGSTNAEFQLIRAANNVFDISFVKNFEEKAAHLKWTVPACLFIVSLFYFISTLHLMWKVALSPKNSFS